MSDRRDGPFATVEYFQDLYGWKPPSKFIVCPTCEGSGSHVNPDIDRNGLTRNDFDEDPFFEEDYFSGRFDVSCYECNGVRVVEEPIFGLMTESQIEEWLEYLEGIAQDRAERNMMLRGYQF